MIRYFLKRSGESVAQIDSFQPGCLIDVTEPTRDELRMLAEKFSIQIGNLTDALDPDEIPRLERDDANSYIFLRFAYQKPNGLPSTAPLLFVINDQFLMSVAARSCDSLAKIMASDAPISTKGSAQFMLVMMTQIFDDYDKFIKQISHRIQKIIVKMSRHKLENEDFVSFVLIENQLSDFLGALAPMAAILRRLMVGRHSILSDREEDLLEDILLGIEQSVNSCNSNTSRIVSIREAYSTLSNNSLNRSMKALTAATLIIALPNVVFGMYGMNIALPFQHYWWAYPVIIGATLLLVLVIALIARKKRLF